MTPLTSAQRKFLRGQAHHLDAYVIVGKAGVTDALIKAVEMELDAHELIKIRFNDFKTEKKELAAIIEERTNSLIAGIIGHVLILYRQHSDDEKRVIRLPRR